jgi:hypothetical protein
MYRILYAIALFITILTAFIVVDATSALAQNKPITTQITVTEDAAAVLMNWPQDIIAFTSARTPLKSLNDLKSPANWADSGSDLIGPLARLLQACGIPVTSCVTLPNENFPKLFLKNESLKLFVTTAKTKNIDKITKSGGGIKVVFLDKNDKVIEQRGKW